MPTQRLSINEQVTANSAGAATFSFPAPPTDLVWHGTLSCLLAPTGTIFSASIAGTPWCSWVGPAIGGPVQALPGEQLVVTASGLLGNGTYTLQWIGRSDPLSSTAPSYPDASTAGGSSSATQLLGAQKIAINLGTAGIAELLPPPPQNFGYALHRSVSDGSSATTREVVSGFSGFEYSLQLPSGHDDYFGQIVTEGLNWQTTGGGGAVYLTYDLIPWPSNAGNEAFVVRQASTGSLTYQSGMWTSPVTVTIPGGYVTQQNDCIMMSIGWGDSGTEPVVTGAGATWTHVNIAGPPGSLRTELWIGYGCTAGNTSVVVTAPVGAPAMDIVFGILGGVNATSNPVLTSSTGSAISTTVTSGSVAYSPGELIVAAACAAPQAVGNTWTPNSLATWSNGTQDNLIGISQTANEGTPARLDYILTANGSGSTTAQVTQIHSSNIGICVAVLSHA